MTSFNEREAELLVEGLQMRICWIETGTTNMTAVDAYNYNKSIPKPTSLRQDGLQVKKPVEIKALSSEQRRLICELEELITKVRQP